MRIFPTGRPRAATIITALGAMGIIAFVTILYNLAADKEWMSGLDRQANLNFDFNAGEVLFAILGGGAAVWAATTFSAWLRRGSPPPEKDAAGDDRPLSPDEGEVDHGWVSDEEFRGYPFEDQFLHIYRRLRVIEDRIKRTQK